MIIVSFPSIALVWEDPSIKTSSRLGCILKNNVINLNSSHSVRNGKRGFIYLDFQMLTRILWLRVKQPHIIMFSFQETKTSYHNSGRDIPNSC